MRSKLLAACVGLSAAVTPASATIVVTVDSSAPLAADAVTNLEAISGGSAVLGRVSSIVGPTFVLIEGGEPATVNGSTVRPSDGLFDYISLKLVDNTLAWTSLSFNLEVTEDSEIHFAGVGPVALAAGSNLVSLRWDGAFPMPPPTWGISDYPGGGGIQSIGDIRFTTAFLTSVPEPNTWAFMIVGFGFIGGALRLAAPERRHARSGAPGQFNA